MNKILIGLIIFLTYFIVSCTSDAGTGKLPLIKLDPTNISFEDGDLLPYEKSNPQYLEIKNTGEGDLIISKIFFNESTDGDLDYYIEDISGVDYANVVYPITLKKGEIAKVKIILIPTDDGVKEATIQINSNMPFDDKIKIVNVTALDFIANLQINEAIKTSSGYQTKSENVKNLLVKPCVPNLDERTLLNICNIGKASLVVNSLVLEGDAIALEYFELEQLNTPAKILGSLTYEGNCITGLAICHNTDSGVEANLRVLNNSANSPTQVIRLTTE
jgi:hypothetical protein